MTDLAQKQYVVVVQCHLVVQRCSGYFCELSFDRREGGFAGYSAQQSLRSLYMTCGGCCGRGLQRKLTHLLRQLRKHEELSANAVVVQLASCVTHENFHGPPCPHLEYLKTLIHRVGLDVLEGTRISKLSEQRRRSGQYAPAATDGCC